MNKKLTAEEFAKEYYQLDKSNIETVTIESVIRFAEKYYSKQLNLYGVSKRYIVAKEQEGIFEQLCCCIYDDLNKAQDFADAMADTIEHWDSKIVILNVC